jgi:hypothetical protein
LPAGHGPHFNVRRRDGCGLGGRDSLVEAVEPFDHRGPFRQVAIGIDEEGKRGLHAAEGRGGLHQAAELHGAGEIGRADDDIGKNRRHLAIAGGEEGQALL